MPEPTAREAASDRERIERLENAVQTLAWWLTQTPDSLGHKDAEGIENIIRTGHVRPEEADNG